MAAPQVAQTSVESLKVQAFHAAPVWGYDYVNTSCAAQAFAAAQALPPALARGYIHAWAAAQASAAAQARENGHALVVVEARAVAQA